MKTIFLPITLSVFLLGCANETSSQQRVVQSLKYTIANVHGTTILDKFNSPEGYERVRLGGFGNYLRNLKLQDYDAQVHLYNNQLKNTQEVHAAILTIDVGDKNLQQCADAVMRLRAEFLYSKKMYDKIHFNFTNGFTASYSKWIQGYRILVTGNKTVWAKKNGVDSSYITFRRYLEQVFIYAGTLSLSKELRFVPFNEMKVGDVLIHGGSPVHAVIVVDMSIDKDGDQLFMLAQSYMPAQEIHVLKNFNNKNISPWYSMNDIEDLVETPEWVFSANELKRFK